MVYNKESIYKWRENNKDAWDEQMRKNSRAYYEKNKEAKKAKSLENYYKKKEALKQAAFKQIILI